MVETLKQKTMNNLNYYQTNDTFLKNKNSLNHPQIDDISQINAKNTNSHLNFSSMFQPKD